MLSGFCPDAEGVRAVGDIARDLRRKSSTRPGSFFWCKCSSSSLLPQSGVLIDSVLDPVMGDQGRLYVHEDVVPAYKDIIRDADLILPNQFEAE